jgi:nucleotide-binding universal stress UspA family protein
VKAARATARSNSSGRGHRVRATTKNPDRTQRADGIKLLVVVDATEVSKRVLRYIGQLASGCNGPEFHLAYIASHLPAEFLETGGSELPDREERLESILRRRQRTWMTVADRKAWRILRAAQSTLKQAGVGSTRIHACVSSPLDARKTADEVLLLAEDQHCGTVIVGRSAHSWFRTRGGGDLAEQLLRRAKDYAVWVIG